MSESVKFAISTQPSGTPVPPSSVGVEDVTYTALRQSGIERFGYSGIETLMHEATHVDPADDAHMVCTSSRLCHHVQHVSVLFLEHVDSERVEMQVRLQSWGAAHLGQPTQSAG